VRWSAPKIGEKMKKNKKNGVSILPSQLRFGSKNNGVSILPFSETFAEAEKTKAIAIIYCLSALAEAEINL
jgi:hypothetical protein